MRFKEFLINEDHAYLGQKIGDVLTAIQQLEEDSEGMGTRHLMASSEKIVEQIRRILHANWAKSEIKYLATLQKCGVAIMKAIDEKDDLKSILGDVKAEIEKLSGDLGVPQNSLMSPESPAPKTPDSSVDAPEGKEKKPEKGGNGEENGVGLGDGANQAAGNVPRVDAQGN